MPSLPLVGTHVSCTMVLAITLSAACGSASLDEAEPIRSSTQGDTDDADAGDEASTGVADTEPADDGPSPADGCEPGCRITLPTTWAYQGAPDPERPEPGSHRVPALLRHADGTLTVAEQRGGFASLHRLTADGRLQWNRRSPLPCDRCDLSDVGEHPSGDLLLSATGLVIDGGLSLLAAQWDPWADELRWVSALPLVEMPEVRTRSGDIVALGDTMVVQPYVAGQLDFQVQQSTHVAVYGVGGVLIDDTTLSVDGLQPVAAPLLARTTPGQEIAIGLPRGYGQDPYATVARIDPPLWSLLDGISLHEPLDELLVDDRDHTISLGHSFDGDRIHFVLDDRVEIETAPQWVATVAVPSTTDSRAALAMGRDGSLYAAIRTTQYPQGGLEPLPGPVPDPVAGLAVVRWSPGGELRWQSTLVMDLAQSDQPVALVVDDHDGLVVAAIVDERLRVEHREQRCECG